MDIRLNSQPDMRFNPIQNLTLFITVRLNTWCVYMHSHVRTHPESAVLVINFNYKFCLLYNHFFQVNKSWFMFKVIFRTTYIIYSINYSNFAFTVKHYYVHQWFIKVSLRKNMKQEFTVKALDMWLNSQPDMNKK